MWRDEANVQFELELKKTVLIVNSNKMMPHGNI